MAKRTQAVERSCGLIKGRTDKEESMKRVKQEVRIGWKPTGTPGANSYRGREHLHNNKVKAE